jgi:hypothetical protein
MQPHRTAKSGDELAEDLAAEITFLEGEIAAREKALEALLA